MFGLHVSLKRSRTVAIADIGSASAAVGILLAHRSGPSIFLNTHRSFITQEKRAKEHSVVGIAGALKDATDICLKAYRARAEKVAAPTELFAFLRAPWSASTVTNISESYADPMLVTDSIMNAFAKKAVAASGGALSSNLMEATLLRTEINGYQTQKPLGKTARSLLISALISTANEKMKNSAAETLRADFPVLTPQWRSHTRAILTVLREYPAHLRHCLIVDIASEGTSAIVMRDGIIDSQTAFENGVHSILHKLNSNALPDETLGLINMLEHEQCSAEECDVLRGAMGVAEQELVRMYGEEFGKLAMKKKLPNDLLLFVHADLVPWLSRVFSRIDFSQFTATSQPFAVHALAIKDLLTWIQSDTGVAPDVSLALAGALVHIEARE